MKRTVGRWSKEKEEVTACEGSLGCEDGVSGLRSNGFSAWHTEGVWIKGPILSLSAMLCPMHHHFHVQVKQPEEGSKPVTPSDIRDVWAWPSGGRGKAPMANRELLSQLWQWASPAVGRVSIAGVLN